LPSTKKVTSFWCWISAFPKGRLTARSKVEFLGGIWLIFAGRGGNFEFLRDFHQVGLFWKMMLWWENARRL